MKWSIVCLLAGWPLSTVAAPMADYYSEVEGNTVIVCPRYLVDGVRRQCPDKEGMLRQSVHGDEIVRLGDHCVAKTLAGASVGTSEESCYVDECVPPGRYRYGFARPYECGEGYSTYFYKEVDVTAELSVDCVREGTAPVEAADVPWEDSRMICAPDPPEMPSDPPNPPKPGTSSDAGADAEASSHSGGGCSLNDPRRTSKQVLALLLGLALLGLRRRR